MYVSKVVLWIAILIPFSGWTQSGIEQIGSPTAIVQDIKIDEMSNTLAALTPAGIELWNYESKTLIKSWPVPSIQCIDYNQGRIAGVSNTGKLFIWDVESGKEEQYVITPNSLQSVAWIDNQVLLIVSAAGTIYKVSGRTGDIEHSVTSTGAITAIAKSHDTTILIGNSKGELTIFGNNLEPLKTITAHKGSILEIRAIHNTDQFITTSNDHQLKHWKLPGLQEDKISIAGSWLTTADYVLGEKGSSLIATGNLNGKILVSIGFGKYSGKSNSIVNCLYILKNELPKIKIIAATHGGGIQIITGNAMKFSSH
jgi:hypothetical protein